jgi:hypothetical protein
MAKSGVVGGDAQRPPSLRARLRGRHVQRLLRKNGGSAVAVRPSGFAGLGVFSLRPAPAHSVLCYFRGAALSNDEVDLLDPEARAHHGRYMICSDAGECCVPLRPGGVEPPRMPDALSGSLINEACSRPEGDYEANAYVAPAGGISAFPCPWLGRRFYDWEVRASRDIVPGEELLLCYGPSYGARHGYRVAGSCGEP